MKKAIFLFLAFLLPICIFLFLKFFGKNEFAVTPMYQEVYPDGTETCGIQIALPYHIPDSIQSKFAIRQNDLTLIYVGRGSTEAEKQFNRLEQEFKNEIEIQTIPQSAENKRLKTCIFFLKDPYDLVLVDKNGTIRGQYIAKDREEIDRMLTEITILLKRY